MNEERRCEYCQAPLVQKTHANGKPESGQAFRQRRFCNQTCRGHWQEIHGCSRRPNPSEEEIAALCAEIRQRHAEERTLAPNRLPRRECGLREYTTGLRGRKLVIKAS